jgi:nucleotide-binding universal stress UspA family protein
MGRVICGVDGSEGSVRALGFALEEARLRGWSLTVVSIWESPYLYGYKETPPPAVSDAALADAARKHLDMALEETEASSYADVNLEARTAQGSPSELLCEMSADADLLVLGARGHGGFAGLLLGSVSTQCAHHSRCPVVIVPRDNTDRSRKTSGD